MELRRRGYDVEARPKDGLYVSDWQKLFKGFNIHRVKAKKKADALSELKSNIVLWGNGARGGIFVEWDGNAGGHFFNVEVINGKAVFIDGQSNKYGKVVENYFKRVKPSSILYGRWDTLKPTASIKSAVKNRL